MSRLRQPHSWPAAAQISSTPARRRAFSLGGIALLLGAGVSLTQPAFGAPQSPPQARQIHEIRFKEYPARALAAGEEGPVFFKVTLDKEANASTCVVTRSSGHPLLDAETCELIVQRATFTSAFDSSGHIATPTLEAVVNWTIPGHAPHPIDAAGPASSPDESGKQICKRTLRSGTLSNFERTCLTATEWAKQSDQQKQVFEDVQGRKGSSVCSASEEPASAGPDSAIAGAPAPGC
jgi:protein TonB